MKITGNEPAYPVCDEYPIATNDKGGLTIRQRFTMAAMQSRTIADAILSAHSESRIATPQELAGMACIDADALINQLNATSK